ncbi:hypothetical protein [Nocardioides pocheonensis]|uniref:hypothetical protein n=1 Tax=Nocardioides pocheonensis TaxID=661485 RepID=UPI00161CFF49|nr:hypothetical protein [Nocardioides pocheonensis]
MQANALVKPVLLDRWALVDRTRRRPGRRSVVVSTYAPHPPVSPTPTLPIPTPTATP